MNCKSLLPKVSIIYPVTHAGSGPAKAACTLLRRLAARGGCLAPRGANYGNTTTPAQHAGALDAFIDRVLCRLQFPWQPRSSGPGNCLRADAVVQNRDQGESASSVMLSTSSCVHHCIPKPIRRFPKFVLAFRAVFLELAPT